MVKVQGRDELDEICVPHPSREDVYNKIRMQRVGVRLGEGSKVVLSACNSGRGKIKAECMVGLARGFLLGRVAWCRRPRLAMLRLARRPADRPACVRKGCGRRAAGGVEAADALGGLPGYGRQHAPPPRRHLSEWRRYDGHGTQDPADPATAGSIYPIGQSSRRGDIGCLSMCSL